MAGGISGTRSKDTSASKCTTYQTEPFLWLQISVYSVDFDIDWFSSPWSGNSASFCQRRFNPVEFIEAQSQGDPQQIQIRMKPLGATSVSQTKFLLPLMFLEYHLKSQSGSGMKTILNTAKSNPYIWPPLTPPLWSWCRVVARRFLFKCQKWSTPV